MTDEVEVTRLAVEWRKLLEQHEAQAARVREYQPLFDSWAPLVDAFSPGELIPEVAAVLEHVQPGETWLDVGCGAGRIAAHLATKAGRVLAVDSSRAMSDRLRQVAGERGVENLQVLPASPWPLESVGEPVDVVFSAHVLYFVHNVVPFLQGMEAHARRRCMVLLGDEAGALPSEEAWRVAHHEPMSRMPALGEFEQLMKARGIALEVAEVPFTPPPVDKPSVDEAFAMLIRRCMLRHDSPKATRLRRWFDEQRQENASFAPLMAMTRMALCSWEPPR